MILKQDTIKDLMLLYDAAELNICSKVMAQLQSESNNLDRLVETTLHDLMVEDKKWGEGGTKRVFQDKY